MSMATAPKRTCRPLPSIASDSRRGSILALLVLLFFSYCFVIIVIIFLISFVVVLFLDQEIPRASASGAGAVVRMAAVARGQLIVKRNGRLSPVDNILLLFLLCTPQSGPIIQGSRGSIWGLTIRSERSCQDQSSSAGRHRPSHQMMMTGGST